MRQQQEQQQVLAPPLLQDWSHSLSYAAPTTPTIPSAAASAAAGGIAGNEDDGEREGKGGGASASAATNTTFSSGTTLSIPLFLSRDQVGDMNLSRLLQCFGSDTLRIYTAILARKRIMFIGHNQAAREVAQMVLTSVSMLSPVLPGLLRRAYPYVTLSDLSFLDAPDGFIAGCTNPMFQHKPAWCDMLCILDSGEGAAGSGSIIINGDASWEAGGHNMSSGVGSQLNGQLQSVFSHVGVGAEASGLVKPANNGTKATTTSSTDSSNDDISVSTAYDKHWLLGVLSLINFDEASEDTVRQYFLEFTKKILYQAYDAQSLLSSQRLNDDMRVIFSANKYRTSLLKNCPEFIKNKQSLDLCERYWSESESTNNAPSPGGSPRPSPQSLRNHIRRLCCESDIHWTELEIIYFDLKSCVESEEQCEVLLNMLPLNNGRGGASKHRGGGAGCGSCGLDCIGVALLSISPNVQDCAHVLLQRMKSFENTKHAFTNLDKHLHAAFSNITESKANGQLQNDKEIWQDLARAVVADRQQSSGMSSGGSVDNFAIMEAMM
jgi:hypothetical protein